MTDESMPLHGSLIQHGKSNDRVYLMKYDARSRDNLYREMSRLAESRDYGKIFIKVPIGEESFFLDRGFAREARIAGYFGSSDGVFMGKYLKEERRRVPGRDMARIDEVLSGVGTSKTSSPRALDGVYSIRMMGAADTAVMAGIYDRVFPSYPFPIQEPEYLRRTMETHVAYFGCFRGEELVALSSAEADRGTAAVEMTDFAVLPENRGRQLALHLLNAMEEYVAEEGFKVAYTIARAVSFGMNKTFSNAGYEFGGTLWNNTQISGAIESMNIWHKRL